jgi:hypothetical protein
MSGLASIFHLNYDPYHYDIIMYYYQVTSTQESYGLLAFALRLCSRTELRVFPGIVARVLAHARLEHYNKCYNIQVVRYSGTEKRRMDGYGHPDIGDERRYINELK